MALLATGLGVWGLWRLAIDDSGFRIEDFRLKIQRRQGVRSRPYGIAFSITLLSIVWFYLATFVIVPSYAVEVYDSAENPYWARYGALGDSPVDIVKSLFTQPDVVWQIASEPTRVDYLWTMLATFGFLSLLAPEILLLSLPLLLANLLSAYPPQYYGEFHYSAPLIAYFGVSAIYGAARLARGILGITQGFSPSYQHMPAAASWVMALVAMVRNSRTVMRPLLFGLVIVWVFVWG